MNFLDLLIPNKTALEEGFNTKYKIKLHNLIIYVGILLAMIGILLWLTGNSSNILNKSASVIGLGYMLKCEYLQKLLMCQEGK